MDIIVDFETMGLRENAILLSLGMVAFDLEDKPSIENLRKNSLHIKLSTIEQQKSGEFSYDKTVVQWWKKQDQELILNNVKPSKHDKTIKEACKIISEFLNNYDYYNGYLWSRGNDFDIPKLRNMFRFSKMNYPFNVFKVRDVRTYIDILGGVDNGKINDEIEDDEFNALTKHDPLCDTIRDAYLMQYLYHQ